MLTEQNNKRLKYANNRFVLKSESTMVDKSFWQSGPEQRVQTIWRIDDYWDYASFKEQRKKRINHVTVLPVKGGKSLT